MQKLRDILQRCNAATPGPWRSWIEGRDHTSGSNFIQTAAQDIEMSGASSSDYDFIAHARQDIPNLVKEIAQLKGWKLD